MHAQVGYVDGYLHTGACKTAMIESDLAAVEHSHDEAQEGEHDQNMKESSLAEETRMAHKKLRSLFKERRKDKEN